MLGAADNSKPWWQSSRCTGSGGCGSGLASTLSDETRRVSGVQPETGQLPPLTISTLQELQDALRLSRPIVRDLRIEMIGLSREHSDALEDSVRKYSSACGCREGQIGLLTAASVSILLKLALRLPRFSGRTQLGLFSGSIAVGALTGKLIGLVRTRADMLHVIASYSRAGVVVV